MLLKLFKYDMKKAMKSLIVMLIVIAGTTVLGVAAGILYGAIGRYVSSGYMEGAIDDFMQVASTEETVISYGIAAIIELLSMFVMSLCQIAPFAVCVVYVIMNYKHFRTDVLSDRGYLTLTLPVTAKQILVSKLLSAFIGTAILALVSFVSAAAINFSASIAGSSLNEIVESYDGIADGLFNLYFNTAVGIFDIAVCAVLLPLTLIAFLLYVYISFYFFNLLGYAIAKRKKTGAGIGLFLGGSYLLYIVVIALVVVTTIAQGVLFNLNNTGDYFEPLVCLTILPAFLLIVALGVVMWFVGKHLLGKKIDLL